jgi:hypothetical protein
MALPGSQLEAKEPRVMLVLLAPPFFTERALLGLALVVMVIFTLTPLGTPFMGQKLQEPGLLVLP